MPWSHSISVVPRGVALAREKRWVVARDAGDWVYLLNAHGERQGQSQFPGVAAVSAAEDGSAYAAVGAGGEVWLLAPDLMPRWERRVVAKGIAVALDPLAQYVAVADSTPLLSLFDRFGRLLWQVATLRPLHHLVFVPEAPFLIGSADYGVVACYDAAGRDVWHDTLVAHVGALAVSGNGQTIVAACYSDGVRRYDLNGKNLSRLPVSEPAALIALSYDARTVLVAGMVPRLSRFDGQGKPRGVLEVPHPAIALVLSARGDEAVVAYAGGPVEALDVRELAKEPSSARTPAG